MKKSKEKWQNELKDFMTELFAATGKPLSTKFLDGINIQILTAGDEHNPKDFESLQEKCCCYMFCEKDTGRVFKIGKVTSTNQSRYRSHHYKISDSISSFARSLHKSKNYAKMFRKKKLATGLRIILPE